jgi:mxaJ protein
MNSPGTPPGRRRLLAAVGLLLASGFGGAVFGEEPQEPIRVCADPDNLPYSNQQLEGFENKIAEVIGQGLGRPVSYYWWPHQMGLVRKTLRTNQCDVLIAIPKGYDPVLWTKPYFRSTYAMAYRKDRNLGIRSLEDPALKSLKIGVHLNTPPYDVLGNLGLAQNLATYRLYFDARDLDPAVRPQRVLEDMVSGSLDVAVTWGPLVGYFARKHPSPALELVPLEDDRSEPMSFEFSMGVRKGERELKSQLEEVLDRRQAEIRKIFEEYGVPLLPLKPAGDAAERTPPSPGSHKHESSRQ